MGPPDNFFNFKQQPERASGEAVSSNYLLDFINEMIVEYDNQAHENNVPNPLDSEMEMRLKGKYGAMALEDLLERLKSNSVIRGKFSTYDDIKGVNMERKE